LTNIVESDIMKMKLDIAVLNDTIKL